MSLTPLKFTGVSSYSSDLQTVLDRAVSIASIPLKSLQNEAVDNLEKKTLLSSFETAVNSLGTSLRSLAATSKQQALAASSSNSSKVAVSYTGAEAPATYTISEITSVARAASETSAVGYANSASTPVSSTGSVKLMFGTKEYNITLAADKNNLLGLRDAINGLDAGVTASILTTGTGANPNYLSLTADSTGAKTLELRDDPSGANTNLLTSANQGADAVFKLNGVSVQKASNQINDVVSGLTFTIKGTTTGSETVDLSLTTDRSRLSTALSAFASDYNDLVDQVNAQVGPAAGKLSGDFIVSEVQNVLRKISAYEGSGSIQGLASLGLEFDIDGKITFKSETLNALSDEALADAFDFLGSETTGLGALSEDLDQLADPVSGLIQRQVEGYDRTDARLQNSIATLEERISATQASVAEKLQLADALLASLDTQQQILDGSLKAVSLSLFGKNEG